MKKHFILLAVLIETILLLAACGSSKSNNGRNKDIEKTVANTETSKETGGEFVANEASNTNIDFGGYNESAQFAIMKDSFKPYALFDSYAIHSMTLQNNSKDSIHITKVRVIVNGYEPLETEDYVLCRVGGGDEFDQYFGLYSQVEGRAQSYDAYSVDLDKHNYLIKDSIDWNPIMRLDVAPADTLKVKFFIEFMDTGLYDYDLVVEYEYNGKVEQISGGMNSIIYENDQDALERAHNEFLEDYDYYMDNVKW